MIKVWIGMAAVLVVPSFAVAEPLELICHGTGTHLETTETFATARSGMATAQGDATTYRRAREEDSLRVRLDGAGGGKLKMPTSLIPPISRGKDGWWDFTKLEVTDDAIRGQVSLNIVNHPSVVIDRHTGDIDMKGLSLRFNGSCEKVTAAPEERKF